MNRILRDDALESGNYILMCYQDVLKVLKTFKVGGDSPDWFDKRVGTCANVGFASEKQYGVSENTLFEKQRYVLEPSVSYSRQESKLDYLLNQMWVENIQLPSKFVDINSTKTFPIAREFPNMSAVGSWSTSATMGSMYRGNQLDARIDLMEFKCKILSDELNYIWKNFGNGQTTKDFKKIFED